VLKDRRFWEIIGLGVGLLALIVLLSLFSYNDKDYQNLVDGLHVTNWIGPMGAWLSYILKSAFGIASYMIVIIFSLFSWSLIKNSSIYPVLEKSLALFFLLITLSTLASLLNNMELRSFGGYTGYYLHHFMILIMGEVGTTIMIVILNIVGLISLGALSLNRVIEKAEEKGKNGIPLIRNLIKIEKTQEDIPFNSIDDELKSSVSKKKKKRPWITKKKIIVYESEEINGYEDAMKYLALSVPMAQRDAVPIAEESHKREELINSDNQNFTEIKVPQIEVEPFGVHDHSEGTHDYDKSFDDVFADDHEDIDDAPDEDKICGTIFQEDVFFDDENNNEDDFNIEEIHSSDMHNFAPVEKSEDEIKDNIDIVKNRITEISCEDKIEEKKVVLKELTDSDENEIENISEAEKVFEEIPINHDYIIPTSFLHSSVPIDKASWKEEVKKNSVLLVDTLKDFGIEARVVNVNRGPVITLYEMQIASGIRINKVTALSDDIAMALAAYRVRIVAPIPGKSAIGIELPNSVREGVTLGDVIKSDEYQSREGFLKVGLGKDILGKPVTIDLKKQPHLLIAGATGAGKSVCVNSIISSILYNYNPNHVKFIMVDPKMVELQLYDGLPHLLTPVITEPHSAPAALKWAIYEMERRYRLLSEFNTRDIERYNEKISFVKNVKYERIPYIVIIIDELADLMMVAPKDIEGHITRIAQKARAVGIHMVLATQRPSVDVITGIIKANFPARIAFQVAQKTDSRTILDQNGAEKLLGKGDMLYQSPTTSYPVRIQGAFISEDEIEKVAVHLKAFGKPQYIDLEAHVFQVEEEARAMEDNGDELFVEALKIIEETRKASASYLQRRLSIGYNRAARIIEQMEDMGYVGPQQGSKPREVLI